MTAPFQIAPVLDAYAAHFLRCDQTAEASLRAVHIMDRVLPNGRRGHNPMTDAAAFIGAATRHGDRQALYAAIYPRLLAKVQARDAADLRADEELSLSSASEGVVHAFGKAA